MKYIIHFFGTCLLLLTTLYTNAQTYHKQVYVLYTLGDSASYALGINMAQSMKQQISMTAQQFEGIDSNVVFSAFNEYFNSSTSLMDSAAIQFTMMKFQEVAMSQKNKNDEVAAAINIEASDIYIAEQMAANPKLKKTSSGLVYEVLKKGNGKKPTSSSTVSALYKGMLIDDTIFDESKEGPREFPLNGVIKGWTEGLQLMSEGAIFKLIIPQHLAYGYQERPPYIKSGATLVFEVTLVKVLDYPTTEFPNNNIKGSISKD